MKRQGVVAAVLIGSLLAPRMGRADGGGCAEGICEFLDLFTDQKESKQTFENYEKLQQTVSYVQWLVSFMYRVAVRYQGLARLSIKDVPLATLKSFYQSVDSQPYFGEYMDFMDGKLAALDDVTNRMEAFVSAYSQMYPGTYDPEDEACDPETWLDDLRVLRDARSTEDVSYARALAQRQGLRKAALIRALTDTANQSNTKRQSLDLGIVDLTKSEATDSENRHQESLDVLMKEWAHVRVSVDAQTRLWSDILELQGLELAAIGNDEGVSYDRVPVRISEIAGAREDETSRSAEFVLGW